MDKDLFGDIIIETRSKMNTMRRITTRQVDMEGRDLYTTEPVDIERFLWAAKRDDLEIPGPIWEPAAGLGDISKTLIQYGYKVFSTDLYAYRDETIDIPKLDFFVCSKLIDPNVKAIFTNPPYNVQEEFLLHALSFGVDVVFFVRLSFLSSKGRRILFMRYRPTYVYVYSGRAHCHKYGDKDHESGMIDYCIVVWKPPYKTETITRWIECMKTLLWKRTILLNRPGVQSYAHFLALEPLRFYAGKEKRIRGSNPI